MNARAGLEIREPEAAATMTADRPASPKVDEAAEAKRGEREGRRWAIYQATAVQLSVLAAMAEEYEPANDLTGAPVRFLDFWLALTIGDVYGQEFMDARSYRSIFPKPAPPHSPTYLRGFVRAAAAAWREVAEQVG